MAVAKRCFELKNLQVTRLTENALVQGPALPPDGRFLIDALREADEESLWLKKVAASTEVHVLANSPAFHGLTCSKDGTYI